MTDPTTPRVEALLAQMTLTEKVGQLHQAHGLGRADHDEVRVGTAIVATSATAGNARPERVRAAE